jgi:hypothetical protein
MTPAKEKTIRRATKVSRRPTRSPFRRRNDLLYKEALTARSAGLKPRDGKRS